MQGAELPPLENNCTHHFSKGLFLNFAYMEKLDSMFVHLTVPVTSSSAFPSRLTLTFSDFNLMSLSLAVILQTQKCSIGTFATQRHLKGVAIFCTKDLVFSLDLRE